MVGGYALAAHGHPRYTGDIDFWVRPTPDNLQRRIDLLTSIDGVAFDDAYARRDAVVFGGATLNIIGLEDFRANKRSGGRPMDLADLEELDTPDRS